MNVENVHIAQNKYGKYAIPMEVKNNPRFDVKQILKGKIHEPDTIEYMLKHGQNGLVIHAGTFYGDFLPALNQLPLVWAFEPYKRYYECAWKTMALNFGEDEDDWNIGLFNMGLGEGNYTKAIMHTGADGNPLGGEAFLAYDDYDKLEIFKKRNEFDINAVEEQNEMAEIVPLDDIARGIKNVSIIQYDLEGYEEKALMGSVQTIDMFRPILILEAWRDSSDKKPIPNVFQTEFFESEILARGYRVVDTLHHNIVLKAK